MTEETKLVVVGVDPGLSGGIAVLINDVAEVYDPPTYKIEKAANSKATGSRDYDLKALVALLHSIKESHPANRLVFMIEKVLPRPGEGSVSAFHFGQGCGYLKMLAVALGFELYEVRPQAWKKVFQELTSSGDIDGLRDAQKLLRLQSRTTKDTVTKNSIKKELKSINLKIKGHAKDAARELAKKMYPAIAEKFELKKHDGRAEAVLIAKYTQLLLKEKDELV